MSKETLPDVVAVDANFLVMLIDPTAADEQKARANHLLERLEKAKRRLVVPMPALAEFLVHANSAALSYVDLLDKKKYVDLAPFDRLAAHDCALLDAAALGRKAKKDGSDAPWQKVKIDRQIVAIAKSRGARLVVSNDDGVRSAAQRAGIAAVALGELDLPASAAQTVLQFDEARKKRGAPSAARVEGKA